MYTDAEIQGLIDQVSSELDKANTLAKSEKLKKDDEKPEMEAPEAAPEALAPVPEAAAAPEAAPAPEGAMPPGPEGEPGPQDEQISDEELGQIYQSMPPEEQQRHMAILQQVLQGGQEQPPAPAPAPSPEAPMAMSEKAIEAALSKSEEKLDAKFQDIAKKYAEIAKSVELLTQAIEAGFKPVRKSVVGIEFTEKGAPQGDKPLSKAELTDKIKEFQKQSGASMKKTDRDLINSYLLHGVDKEKVEKMVIGG